MKVKVKAVFKGQDGSLGYKTNMEYTLRIKEHVLIIIERLDGEGKCEYGTIVSFLDNWDNIIRVN